MPFIPPQAKSEGQFIRPNLPFSAVASASWRQGIHDSFWNQIYENWEDSIYDDGRLLTPDEANERYSVPGLEFNEPISNGLASLKFRRKREEISRQKVMELGSEGLFSARGLGSLAVSVVANNANPIDFAFNFVPIAGLTRYGRASAMASKMAAGRVAGSLDDIGRAIKYTKMPAFHRMVAAGIDASIGNLILEVPLYWQNRDDQTRHTMGDVALNVGMGGLFGAGLSGLGSVLRAASSKWVKASKTTRSRAIQAAMGDLMSDRTAASADMILAADLNNIEIEARAKAQHVLVDAIHQAETELPRAQVVAAAQAAVEDGVRISPDDLIASVERNANRIKAQSPQVARTVSQLLPAAKAGDEQAASQLARLFDMEVDARAQDLPAQISDGMVGDKGFRKSVSDARAGKTNPAEVQNMIKREVADARNRIVRESYKEGLRKIKTETAEAKARAAKEALDAEAATSKPLRGKDEGKANQVDQGEIQSQIDELISVVDKEAPESLKAAPERVDEDAIKAGIACAKNNAS